MISDKLLRMKEVSTLLGVTPQTLRNWSNEGYIQAVVGKGGQRRFNLNEVRRLMNFAPHQFISLLIIAKIRFFSL